MKRFSEIYIPLKYKILSIQLFIFLTASGVFLYLTQLAFFQDKAFFIMDLNFALLDGAYSAISTELKSRFEVAKRSGEQAYRNPRSTVPLSDDTLGLRILQVRGNQLEKISEQANTALFKKRGLPEDLLATLDARRPLRPDSAAAQHVALLNRTVEIKSAQGLRPLPVLTVLLRGETSAGNDVVIAVDFLTDFLRRAMRKSEIADLFLIHKSGMLLAHPSDFVSLTFVETPFHPAVVEQLQKTFFSKESSEIQVEGTSYFSNVLDTGIEDIYLVSMVSKQAAFRSLTELLRRILFWSVVVLYAAVLLSIIAASRVTKGLRVLQSAAEAIGSGNLTPEMMVETNDEVAQVSDRMQWMARRISHLLTETAEKSRMEGELKTAQIVQSTLMSKYSVHTDAFELESFYRPATECSGDIFDSYLNGHTLTFLVGDATGHGAPAAIVTAIVKGALSTIGRNHDGTPPPPQRFLEILNEIVYECCRGTLLMTMCVVQLDCSTGELTIANAGHEGPFHIPVKKLKEAEKRKANLVESIFVRGERLGFARNSQFETLKVQLEPEDALCLYTDGITDAKDPAGTDWGERALKKLLAQLGDQGAVAIRDGVSQSVLTHVGNASQLDDYTFTILRWMGGAGSAKKPEENAEELELERERMVS